MKKINKEFEDKCLKLKNRIQRLKVEEEDYRKKLRNHIKREEQDKLIKDDKERLKEELKNNRKERIRELYNKKELIRKNRKNALKIREERKSANFSQKKMNYKNILTDKILNKVIREQLNTLQKNKNSYSHAKIRQELNEYEANKKKRTIEKENFLRKQHENNINKLKQLEKEMRSTCDKLEMMEKVYLEKLNKTKYDIKVLGDTRSFNYGKRIKKNKGINKSMEDYNTNRISKYEDEGETRNRNRSLIVNRNRYLSPVSKSEKNMKIMKKQKSKKNTISINYYPKTNRAKSSNKLGINTSSTTINKDKEKDNKDLKKNLFNNKNNNFNKK
jgi:hypothetical protein